MPNQWAGWRVVALTLTASTILLAACGGTDEASTESATETETVKPTGSGIRVVSAAEAAAIEANQPENLVILDVRTPEEFAQGHLDGAVMIDFYRDDFKDQLAGLDPDVPYLIYCRSGNRSGQATAMMEELGFSDVADIDGGILAWQEAGLNVVVQ